MKRKSCHLLFTFSLCWRGQEKKGVKIGKSQKKKPPKPERENQKQEQKVNHWSCRAAMVTTFSTRTLRTTLQVWTYQERDIIWLASLASWTGVSSSLQQTCQWYDIESGDQKEKLFLTFWHDWRRSWGGRTTPGELFINTVAIGVLTCGYAMEKKNQRTMRACSPIGSIAYIKDNPKGWSVPKQENCGCHFAICNFHCCQAFGCLYHQHKPTFPLMRNIASDCQRSIPSKSCYYGN